MMMIIIIINIIIIKNTLKSPWITDSKAPTQPLYS